MRNQKVNLRNTKSTCVCQVDFAGSELDFTGWDGQPA